MRSAAQLDILRIRRATGGEWHHVVELHESAHAASSASSHERAGSLIATPDLASDSRWDVPGYSFARARLVWTGGGCALLLLQPVDQRGQRAIEHGREVPVRDDVPQQILRVAQLVVRGAGRRDWTLYRSGASGAT